MKSLPILRVGLSYALDLFLPRYCLICGRQLYHFERHICTGCLYDLPRTFFWQSRYNKMSEKFNALLQRHLQMEDVAYCLPVKYVYAVALFYYTGDSSYREITRQLKYEYDLAAGRFFTSILVRYLRQCTYLQDADIILPVPLHPWRRWTRGYNQAGIISGVIAEGLGMKNVPDFLIRRHYTRTQTKLSVEEKSKNVAHAFQVNEARWHLLADGKPHHLVLVDDVFTTGSTMFACYQAIMDRLYSSKIDFREIRISLVTLGYVGN